MGDRLAAIDMGRKLEGCAGQWLNYKFGAHAGTPKKFRALLPAEGAPLKLLVPIILCDVGPVNARQQLLGAHECRSPLL